MKVQIVPRCAHDLPNGVAFGIAAVAAEQCLEVTENGMTTKYQPNDANQYAKIAHGTEVVVPEYDPQGNCPSLRSRPAKWLRFEDTAIAVKQWPHDATRKYTWDADIHLMSVTTQGVATVSVATEKNGQAGAEGQRRPAEPTLPHLTPHNALDEAPSKTTTTRFGYDALHRRLGRVKDDGEVTVFVYEGWSRAEGMEVRQTNGLGRLGLQPRVRERSARVNCFVIAEKTVPKADARDTGNFKLETRYVWGEDLSGSLQGAGGIGGLLSSVQAGSLTKNEAPRTTNFFQYDSNGNVFLLTDSQGRESARYAYDAFGKTLTAAGPAAQMNRYRFSTKPVEEGSGLVYYGYRYYDPVTGRWPSRDPIGEMGGAHLYVAVNNRLTYSVDVMGLTDPITSCSASCTGHSGLSGHNHEIRYTRTKTCTLEWFRRIEGGGVMSPIDLNWYEHPAGNQCDAWDESGRPDGPGGINSDCNVTSERVVSAGASSIEWVIDEAFRRKWKWTQDETVQLKFCCTFP